MPEGENKITIKLDSTSNSWVAIFSGPHAIEINNIMGTVDIPTPYTAQANPEMVAERIRAKNPGVMVIVE